MSQLYNGDASGRLGRLPAYAVFHHIAILKLKRSYYCGRTDPACISYLQLKAINDLQ